MWDKKERYKRSIYRELRECTTHGLPYVVKEDIHWFERFTWAILFGIFTGLMFMFLWSQYTRFQNAPVVISVDKDYYNFNVSYPAFTVCPADKKGAFLAELAGNYLNTTGQDVSVLLDAIGSANLKTIFDMNVRHPDILFSSQLIEPRHYAQIATNILTMEFSLEEFITDNKNNLKVYVEPTITELGTCHVVNSKVAYYDNPDNWNETNGSSSYENIKNTVYDSDFFLQMLNYSRDYTVYFHSPNEAAHLMTTSVRSTSQGLLTIWLGVSNTKISQRLREQDLHVRKCKFADETINKRYPVYSYNHCLLECKITMIKKLCGCVPHFYKPLSTEKVCSIPDLHCVIRFKKELTQLRASDKTLKNYKHIKDIPKSPRDCKCLEHCETEIYYKETEEYVYQSFIKRLRVFMVQPKLVYVRDMIFSNVEMLMRSGFVINLCIGCSLISLMELVLISFKAIYFTIKIIIQKRQEVHDDYHK